jgi:hypothetical protein
MGALGSETFDGVLDTVAGKAFGTCVTALRCLWLEPWAAAMYRSTPTSSFRSR